MRYLEICAIVKDEDVLLESWLRYHFALGVEHVVLYDNNSRTPLRHSLADYVEQDLVTVRDIALTAAQQLTAYMDYVRQHHQRCRWTAFIDIDEFLVCKTSADLRDTLQAYEAFAGVGINEVVFGSNGHVCRPRADVFTAYPHALSRDLHIKSVVQPARVLRPLSPHHFAYADGACVNEHGEALDGPFATHSSDILQINHYYYQSQQDFADKIARGLATQVKGVAGRDMTPFYAQASQPGFAERSIARHLPLYRVLCKMPLPLLARHVREAADARSA